MVVGESFVVQAHEVQKGCVKIVDRNGIHRRLESELITLSVTCSGLYPRSCQKAGECIRVVVSPGPVRLKERHASEFGCPHDECVIKQSSLSHIGDQCCRGLIHDFRLHRVCLENVRV